MSLIGDIFQSAGSVIGTALGGPIGGLVGRIAGDVIGDIFIQSVNNFFNQANLPVDVGQLFNANYAAAFAQGFGD